MSERTKLRFTEDDVVPAEDIPKKKKRILRHKEEEKKTPKLNHRDEIFKEESVPLEKEVIQPKRKIQSHIQGHSMAARVITVSGKTAQNAVMSDVEDDDNSAADASSGALFFSDVVVHRVLRHEMGERSGKITRAENGDVSRDVDHINTCYDMSGSVNTGNSVPNPVSSDNSVSNFAEISRIMEESGSVELRTSQRMSKSIEKSSSAAPANEGSRISRNLSNSVENSENAVVVTPTTQEQQRRSIRKRYAEAVRKGEKPTAGIGVVENIKAEFVPQKKADNTSSSGKSKVLLILAILLAFILLVICIVGFLSTLIQTITTYLAISTYPSDDSDMLAAEAQYCALEEQLNQRINNYVLDETYDEYEFELDDIEHDPYVLISCITAKMGGAWTIGEVGDIIQDLFDRQYELTEEVETVEDKTKCTVTLTNNDLSMIPCEVLDEEQLSQYAIYMAVLGNRPDLFPNSDYIGKYINGEYEVYEIPPEALEDETFAAMIEEAEKYLGFPYVWGGSSPSTSFDCSGFICWVINHSGWNIGRTSAQGLFNYCTPVSRANAKPGDLIFFTGTYKTDDACSHVGLYVGNNMMLHCGDPISYVSIDNEYWQSHFYAFGRLS